MLCAIIEKIHTLPFQQASPCGSTLLLCCLCACFSEGRLLILYCNNLHVGYTESHSACMIHKSLVLHGFGIALYSDGLVKIEIEQSSAVILSAAENGGIPHSPYQC